MFYVLVPKFEYQSTAYGLFASAQAAEDYQRQHELTDSHRLCGITLEMNPTVVKPV